MQYLLKLVTIFCFEKGSRSGARSARLNSVLIFLLVFSLTCSSVCFICFQTGLSVQFTLDLNLPPCPGWPGTHSDTPALAFQVLGLGCAVRHHIWLDGSISIIHSASFLLIVLLRFSVFFKIQSW